MGNPHRSPQIQHVPGMKDIPDQTAVLAQVKAHGQRIDALAEATGSAASDAQKVRGRLRVNVDPLFARLILGPRLGAFMDSHPELEMELRSKEDLGDLMRRRLLEQVPGQNVLLSQPIQMRFNELRRRIDGLSQKMLSQSLRSLERDGLVTRTVEATMPVTVTYRITPLGRDLLTALRHVIDCVIKSRVKVLFDGGKNLCLRFGNKIGKFPVSHPENLLPFSGDASPPSISCAARRSALFRYQACEVSSGNVSQSADNRSSGGYFSPPRYQQVRREEYHKRKVC